jgi:hypothetical protein
LPVGFLKITSELLLQEAVNPLQLLFLTELNAIIGRLLPSLPVISRGIFSSFKGTFVTVTAIALKKQLDSLSPA